MKLVVATRGSPLAMTQTHLVMDLLRARNPAVELEISVVQTMGDQDVNTPISEMGGKAVFASALEQALSMKQADIAVHSAKDLSSTLPRDLVLGAITKRADPRDVLVGVDSLGDLPPKARVATGSVRRKIQLQALRPDLEFFELRGNIQTRLERLGEFDAVVVAAAALQRLGLNPKPAVFLDPSQMLPQVGQGFLAVQYLGERHELGDTLGEINDLPSQCLLEAERGFLKELGGDCSIPAGAYATYIHTSNSDLGEVQLEGMLADARGVPQRANVYGELNPKADPVKDARALGTFLAQELSKNT